MQPSKNNISSFWFLLPNRAKIPFLFIVFFVFLVFGECKSRKKHDLLKELICNSYRSYNNSDITLSSPSRMLFILWSSGICSTSETPNSMHTMISLNSKLHHWISLRENTCAKSRSKRTAEENRDNNAELESKLWTNLMLSPSPIDEEWGWTA